MSQFFNIPVPPMGAPRMNRADAWKKRPVVLRYRKYKDLLRLHCRGVTKDPLKVAVIAYIAMPESWSAKKRDRMQGQPHRSKPDWDNIAKGICDSLWGEDSIIAAGSVEKYWTNGTGWMNVEVTEPSKEKQ